MRLVPELLPKEANNCPELVLRINFVEVLLHDGRVPDGFEEYRDFSTCYSLNWVYRTQNRTLNGLWLPVYLEYVVGGLHRVVKGALHYRLSRPQSFNVFLL